MATGRMPEIVVERKHEHRGGAIVTSVSVDQFEYYSVTIRSQGADGRSLDFRLTSSDFPYYPDLLTAQHAADIHVRDFLGHQCTSSCGHWPQPLRQREGRPAGREESSAAAAHEVSAAATARRSNRFLRWLIRQCTWTLRRDRS